MLFTRNKSFREILGLCFVISPTSSEKNSPLKAKDKATSRKEKHISENKPEEIKQEPRCKEEDKKIIRSALASRQALKKWNSE